MTPGPTLVDSHVHLNSERFAADRPEVLARAIAAGVALFIVPGYDLASSAAAVDLAARHPNVFATVGLHPHDARAWPTDGAALRALAAHDRVVAIGETGLDFYRNLSPAADQRTALRAQLALAAELGKPVVIHDRDAHAAVLAELAPWVERLRREGAMAPPFGVMHCFSGDLAFAQRCLALDFLVSIAGPVTYPKAEALAEVVRAVPLEALLIETDAPYLPPQPWRGKRNEPAYLRYTAATIARLRGIPVTELARAVLENTRRLFRLPVSVGSAA